MTAVKNETRLLDGRRIAQQLKDEAAVEIEDLKRRGLQPGLAVVLVGDDPASHLYVKGKVRACRDLGIHSETIRLEAGISNRELLSEIGRLNRDDEIDGILVQLPLPSQIDTDTVLQAVHPAKDIDGFHPLNLGKLALGKPFLVPCTPMGILELLKREQIRLEGAEAVIIGRSRIVGKPLAQLLLMQNCTVTICHSRTRELARVCRRADLLVAAVGRPALVTRDFIKPGAVVIDVGVNRIQSLEEVRRLFGKNSRRLESFERRGSTVVGDVHPRDPLGVAAAVTPVPGGVGPLTIAQLMRNTVLACHSRRVRSSRVQPQPSRQPHSA